MNLVMIGSFKELRDARKAKTVIDQLVEQIGKESGNYSDADFAVPEQRLSDAIHAILKETNTYILSPAELQQFELDVKVEQKGKKVRITTDEVDVSGFLKILLDNGARVEVYSAHHYSADDSEAE